MADAFTTFLNMTNPENGASADTWGTKENADRVTVDAMLSKTVAGLTLSAAGGTATFGIAVGAAGGMVLSSAYTKTASTWALGTAAGSLDTGAIANSTWYHVWLIQRSDTGVVDVLTSLSATAPTMPTNYDRKWRIGAMKTDGSAQWVKFIQLGDVFRWATPIFTTGAQVGSTARVSVTLNGIPTGVIVLPILAGYVDPVATDSTIWTSLDETDTAPTRYNSNIYSAVNTNPKVSLTTLHTNTSAQIGARSDNVGSSSAVDVYGWVDPRGKW